MPRQVNMAAPAMKKLLKSDEDQLFEQLGMRMKTMTLNPSSAGTFDMKVKYDGATMGLKEDIQELGRKIFKRWNAETHDLVCGKDAADSEDRGKLLEALGLGPEAVAAFIAGLLITNFALAPALAAVIAAIIIKRYFSPAFQEFCSAWTNGLKA